MCEVNALSVAHTLSVFFRSVTFDAAENRPQTPSFFLSAAALSRSSALVRQLTAGARGDEGWLATGLRCSLFRFFNVVVFLCVCVSV